MSYNSYATKNGLGMPVTGFAARRAANGSNIKRLSFEPTAKTLDSQDNGAPTPRTSRSHLLAGLRTAPKSATSSNFPSTAPPTQVQHSTGNNGLNSSRYADNGPKTSGYASYNQGVYQMNQHIYSQPEQILAPPEIHIDDGQDGMDPNYYAHLVTQNLYLAEQQQRLQQQLANLKAVSQQMQVMNLNGQQYSTPPITPQNLGMYQQQMKQNMQPIITQVSGAQPGVYSCYNPMTGQQTYFMDNSGQQYVDYPVEQRAYSPLQQPGTPRFQVSPPPQSDTPTFTRSTSPPKKSASPPQDHAPLPPPSAGAFRRGHRTSKSMAMSMSGDLSDSPKTTLPGTPSQMAFGPGAGRAGEHPVRQPRGPPPIEELKAKPSAKFEGSKNFATRTRRSAVHNLVRAGLERRRAPGSASGSMSPVSEDDEISFLNDDNDSDSGRSGSGSLSGRPNPPSSRTSQHGAIGSNRPTSRQNSLEMKSVISVDSFTAESVSGDEQIGGSFAAVFKNGGKKPEIRDVQKKAPMLVLTSAEKRKSSIF